MRQQVPFDEVQPGDIATVTATYGPGGEKATITGEVYIQGGCLYVGGTRLYRDEFDEAYRERKLPTEPGSIITKIKTDYVRHPRDSKTAVLGKDGWWWYATLKDAPENIIDWVEVC